MVQSGDFPIQQAQFGKVGVGIYPLRQGLYCNAQSYHGFLRGVSFVGQSVLPGLAAILPAGISGLHFQKAHLQGFAIDFQLGQTGRELRLNPVSQLMSSPDQPFTKLSGNNLAGFSNHPSRHSRRDSANWV